MGIQELKHNLLIEKNYLQEINSFLKRKENLRLVGDNPKTSWEKETLKNTINLLLGQIEIINNAIPKILNSISGYRQISQKEISSSDLVKMNYPKKITNNKEGMQVTIENKDKESFLKKLNNTQESIKKLSRGLEENKQEKILKFKKTGSFAKVSNKLFFSLSSSLVKKGYFSKLNSDLRKANLNSLLTTYLSICFFATLISIVVSVFLIIILGVSLPNLAFGYLFILGALPIITFGFLIFFPYIEGKGIEQNIEMEIPFVTIHMAAIAGSGIEPSQIFKIIALGDEYPAIKEEMKKILNQVNVYGYDLFSALKNIAKETSSSKFSELLNGMALTISEGGSLKEFLEKRAETLVFSYKLEREKYTKTTETLMDIYISLMIAAPMIFIILLVLISVIGGISLGPTAIGFIIIGLVFLLNIGFLIFLQIKQPSY